MKKLKRAISLVIKNEKGEVFMVRRSPSKNTFPGHWSLPAANLSEEEEFGESALRLAKTKLGLGGIKIANDPLAVSDVVERPKNLLKMFNYSVMEIEGDFCLNENEYTEYKWFVAEEFLQHVNDEHDGLMGECTRNLLKHEGLL